VTNVRIDLTGEIGIRWTKKLSDYCNNVRIGAGAKVLVAFELELVTASEPTLVLYRCPDGAPPVGVRPGLSLRARTMRVMPENGR